jgi:hypothetical protein
VAQRQGNGVAVLKQQQGPFDGLPSPPGCGKKTRWEQGSGKRTQAPPLPACWAAPLRRRAMKPTASKPANIIA